MIKFRYKKYSAVASGKILNTNQGLGFKRGRKYDTDLDRLGRMETAQRELTRGMGTFNQEMRKLNRELRGGDSYGTYRIKRFSYQPKRRKLFGLGDMAQGAIDTTRNVVGSTVAGTGNMISAAAPVVGAGTGLLTAGTLGSAVAPITGTMGALGGAATGMGFGLLGGIPGVIAGGILGGIGGGVKGIYDGYKTTAKIGYNLGNSAANAAGTAVQGVGNAIGT